MVYQSISTFIRNAPAYSFRAYNQVRTRGARTFNSVNGYISGIWTHKITLRIRELYIRPLNLTDAIIMGSSLAVAITIMTISIATLSKPFQPMSAVVASVCVAGGWYFSRQRIITVFNAEAAGVIQQMILTVTAATRVNLQLNEFATLRVQLDGHKFEHLKKKELRQLDKLTKSFTDHASARNFEQVKAAYLTHLESLRGQLAR